MHPVTIAITYLRFIHIVQNNVYIFDIVGIQTFRQIGKFHFISFETPDYKQLNIHDRKQSISICHESQRRRVDNNIIIHRLQLCKHFQQFMTSYKFARIGRDYTRFQEIKSVRSGFYGFVKRAIAYHIIDKSKFVFDRTTKILSKIGFANIEVYQ